MPVLARKLARSLARLQNLPEERLPMLAFGLEVLLSETSKFLLLALAAYFLGLETQVFWVVAGMVALRLLAGGPHCSTSPGCALMVLLTIIPLSFLASWQPANLVLGVVLSFTVAEICFWLYAPAAPANKPLKPDHAQRLRRYALAAAPLEGLLALAAVPYFPAAAWAVTLGALWEAFSLTPAGYGLTRGFDKLFVTASRLLPYNSQRL